MTPEARVQAIIAAIDRGPQTSPDPAYWEFCRSAARQFGVLLLNALSLHPSGSLHPDCPDVRSGPDCLTRRSIDAGLRGEAPVAEPPRPPASSTPPPGRRVEHAPPVRAEPPLPRGAVPRPAPPPQASVKTGPWTPMSGVRSPLQIGDRP